MPPPRAMLYDRASSSPSIWNNAAVAAAPRRQSQQTMKRTTSSGDRLTTRRTHKQETLFFGDGLYDLSTEYNEEVSQFKESLATVRQQYSCSDASTNPGHAYSPAVAWMPIGNSTLNLTISVATHPRPLRISVDASCTVSDVLTQIVMQENCAIPAPEQKPSRSATLCMQRSSSDVQPGSAASVAVGTVSSAGDVPAAAAGPKRNSAASIFSHNSRSKTRPLSLSPDTKAPLQSNGRRNSPMARTTNDRNNATDSAPPTVNDKAVTTSYHVTTERLLGPTKSLVLKVAGQAEILKHDVKIGLYQYVHHCLRFNRPIHFEVLAKQSLNSLERTADDDAYDSRPQRFASFMPIAETTSISKRGLDVLTETFGKECDRLVKSSPSDLVQNCDRVLQTAKAFVVSLASVESCALTESLTLLKCICSVSAKSNDMEKVKKTVTEVRNVVAEEVKTYCQAFELGVDPQLVDISSPCVSLRDVEKDFKLSVHVSSAHRLRMKEPVGLMVSLEHAGQLLTAPIKTELVAPSDKLFLDSAIWNTWLDFIPLVNVPREAMVRFVLFKQPDKDTDYEKELPASPVQSSIGEGVHPIGCIAVPVFNFKGRLVTGKQMLGLWPYHQYPPYGFVSSNIIDKESVIIQFKIGFPGMEVSFPPPDPFETMESTEKERPSSPFKDSVEHAIRMIMTKGTAESLGDAEKKWLWNQRYLCWRQVCTTSPQSLGLFLSAVPDWSLHEAGLAHALARSWPSIAPTDALGLLDGQLADSVIRGIAADKLRGCPDYMLCDILPQLLQAVKFDQGHLSSLVLMLFQRAISSVTVAHRLYWNLHVMRTDKYFGKRFDLLHAGLQLLVGSALRQELDGELRLMEKLNTVAKEFKLIPPASRAGVLPGVLEKGTTDIDWPVRLPLSPGMEVSGLRIEKCTYFSSNAAPLKLTFANVNPSMPDISVIYKVGDDLRQDQIVLQMLRIMDNLWQEDGLDLRIITYQCLVFSEDSGMLEIVDSAATMREIQTIDGVTGSFKDSALLSWLSHHNTTPNDLRLAVENFTRSCAGFCVATYILGVCDRHNDNIMIRRSGHLFHIDFSKFLGNAQKFGSFKRDRTPFVLTPDMAYVINNGEQISPNFQEFVDICCRAFNILRHHTSHLANILTLMRTSGMEELAQPDDVQYVIDALMPELTDIEATTAFTRMIEESLKNWFTKFNFFIHNLGQLKSSTAELESAILSFCPKNFAVADTGAVVSAQIQRYNRKDVPETHYIYAIEVVWDDSCDIPGPNSKVVYRRFREFYELQSKLQELVGPNFELPQLPGKLILRRSNTVEVAAKRMEALNVYMMKLLSLNPFISQSDLVVTFFTHFVRDGINSEAEKYASNNQSQVSGSIKLSITYKMRAQKLIVVVGHGKQLARTVSGTLPDPYVKLYMIPDPLKSSKKKTRVMKNTQHPTFNESFSFDLSSFSKVSLQDRQLQVTVWHHETLSKHFLGCVHIDMRNILKQATEETVTEWHKLQPMFS
eukprot:scpid14506/ scgid4649/ Phosphatidylinositol 4-phosphate 3-kinase C2 domain-containing subunit alpha; Phosphoinositide 3-kinase-C2-alpha